MSDHSNSTGSTGSSTNSWTLLSPEEAAVESVGPVDDGTESLGDVPSLSEELAGAAAEFKHIDIPIETVLSEEGHQICQETTPEPSEGPIPSSPSRISPLPSHSFSPLEEDPESQPPVIHDIVASSPSDNDNLSTVPFVTNLDLGTPLEIPTSDLLQDEEEVCCATDNPLAAVPMFDKPVDIGPISERQEEESSSPPEEDESKPGVPLETLTAAEGTEPALPVPHDDRQTEEESKEEPSAVPEVTEEPYCPMEVSEYPADIEAEDTEGPAPVEETVLVKETAPVEETVDLNVEKDEAEKLPEEIIQEEEVENEPESSYTLDTEDTGVFDDGLRRRNLPSFEAPRPRTSDEEEDEEDEEVEFKIEEKKDTKPWLSVNKCIVAGLVLLFLGSLFLSGDIDGPEVTEGEQSQDWLSGDPKEMKELLDKLTQENQQIAQLEAQLKAQKEELDVALKAVAVSGDEQRRADLETENAKLKDELLMLPNLKMELESLRARVTELTALSAPQAVTPAPSSLPSSPEPGVNDGPRNVKPPVPERKSPPNEAHVKQELQRQKKLLEESRKRLETMKTKDVSERKHVRDNLAEIQKRLSEKVEKWGKKKPEELKWKGNKDKKQWKKEEKKEWRGEKDKKEKYRNDEKQVKSKYNSHKEAWRKNEDEWERKKGERRLDREERRKEKPWHNKTNKKTQDGAHHSHKQKPNQQDFWKDQEQKLNRNIRPQLGCKNVEDCAAKEGLYPVELSEFDELLEGYLSKLDDTSSSGKDKIRKLTAQFFENGVFIHDRMRFSDFAEEVADILEDAVDILEGHKDNKSLEEEMEEFEREALWKFAATA
ncbi:pre-B-cell leukemia transcription factor-interacting protein 1 [Periophthalmus magnuspinnatus]|uniref:pre-B-cell leukemia transcription factor-interacting protein 1 n=1 Tax=Periophthalmus magnuspinnatus TaxID=409849 RepID=UPI00145A1DEE|nr:pre-B-cell leukemia transcription factor-interacting protein 1 [Periophthalmus magnuspinnatus]XP_055081295.1 pre-B-cell leukemia transcription factor-interacting protein 1 [Periophthalmus magnuspinnatus]